MRRFPNMDWIIVTPDCTAVWDGAELAFGLGQTRQQEMQENGVTEPNRLKGTLDKRKKENLR